MKYYDLVDSNINVFESFADLYEIFTLIYFLNSLFKICVLVLDNIFRVS